MLAPLSVSVVINTYNNPGHLRRSLAAYVNQTYRHFELVIADDGSKDETRRVIREFRDSSGLTVRHLWHEDRGWTRCRIVNKCIVASTGEYIICTDGDMLPRPDWIATHVKFARRGRFLGGGDYRLPQNVTDAITIDDVLSGRAWDYSWLRQKGLPDSKKNIKLRIRGWQAVWLDRVNLSWARWSGSNGSTFKDHLVEVNGFDERFTSWGKEDHELSVRLWNKGLRSRHVRYNAITMHMEHGRSWVNQEKLKKNIEILMESKRTRSTWARIGIKESGDDHTIEERTPVAVAVGNSMAGTSP